MPKKTPLRTLSFLLIFWLLPVHGAFAQPETEPLVVMNVAAHPDDEDGSTLAYYRHGRDAIAYSVIFTRGEGGQNEIGPELYEELGAVRTVETERAARRLGTQVFFLNFKDFGFSKSAEESYERWGGRDNVTSKLVYLIRKLKPDVMFTNHDTVTVGPNTQHGHHQVVGTSAYAAFELAADPTYHPEQLDEPGVDLWQPKRLFHRLWSGDGPHDVAVPVGDIDQERAISYAAMAADALHEHASQGMDRFAQRLAAWDSTYFVLYRRSGDTPLSATDLAGNLPPNHAADPDLTYWIDSGRLPTLPAGTLSLDDSVAVAGQQIQFRWDGEGLPQAPVRLELFGAIDTTVIIRDDSPPFAHLIVDPTITPTVPEKVYQYENIRSGPPVGYAVYDARGGELLAGGYIDLEIAPPVYLEPAAGVVRMRGGANQIEYQLRVYDPDVQTVTLSAAISRDADETILEQRQEDFDVVTDRVFRDSVVLSLPADPTSGSYTAALTALSDDGTQGASTAGAFVTAEVFEVSVPEGLRVGVVESYDNTLDQALTELDVDHVMLDSTDLATSDFSGLHTIVVDIRAYLVRRDLRTYNERLLEWVRDGGHLVVNYQKTFEWNADSPDPFDPSRNNPGNLAPYPIHISRDRVTRETAPVTILTPDHVLFHAPNEIGDEAWKGWVQERGLYFPDEYDERYLEIFSLHDPDEEPLTGSTLLATVGDGTYLYTALVWYRQLKEFHPGAYRMFANMISLPLADGRTASR